MKVISINEYILLILLAYVVTKIPILGKYVSVLNTLFHELGHAVFALLFQGRVQSISLFANTSGVAVTSYRTWLGKVIPSLAGYPMASLTAFLCFFFIHHHFTHIVLYGFIGITIFSLIFWIRNGYGWVWALSFISLCVFLVSKGTATLQDLVTVFLSGVIFSQAITTAMTIFWISLSSPKDAGDAANLAQATWIPAVIWGFLFVAQSIYLGYLTFKWYIL